MLDERKILAINLLVDGGLQKTEIAKQIGVSRQTLYDWMGNDKEFIAELNRRLQGYKILCEKAIDSRLENALKELWTLQQKTNNSKVKADVLKYFVDRALGKPTTKHEIEASTVAPKTTDGDVLEKEFEEDED
ncbi:phBC6A51 family helix-turn-helix protein [Cytobacillus sp. IB215665]|uniref:phBC6A51 family helix-turn-helix protein n=1 Tax=Cytobacillus sp. IB215665 TaxID=3097357 RepID=UPI002A176808|nr:phBC6A51 family helix-turn-helix protein [Cytobacillus sp. IB215665]MDX8367846.1 phBC6A51 family helix-turn-helix protein [Cytobacillus sp. IB215665]